MKKEENRGKKEASKFFEYRNLDEMSEFITKKLKATNMAALQKLRLEFTASNGVTLYYPAVEPFGFRRAELDYCNIEERPLPGTIHHDALGGIISIKMDHE